MPSMLQRCNELGAIALNKGDLKEARKQFRNMVKEAQKYSEREQKFALNQLGRVCLRDRHYEEAEDSYSKCVELSKRINGPTHPEVAAEMNNLALVLLKRHGNATEAKPLLQAAVQILDDAAPLSSDFTQLRLEQFAIIFEHLGGLLEEERDYEAAEKLYRRALAIFREAEFGLGLPAVFRSVHRLSNLLIDRKRLDEANVLLDEFLPALRQFAETEYDDELNNKLDLIDGMEALWREKMSADAGSEIKAGNDER